MASAFQLQAQFAQLQRASELAGEAFGHGLDMQDTEPAAPRRHSTRWLSVLGVIGLVLLAMAALTG